MVFCMSNLNHIKKLEDIHIQQLNFIHKKRLDKAYNFFYEFDHKQWIQNDKNYQEVDFGKFQTETSYKTEVVSLNTFEQC